MITKEQALTLSHRSELFFLDKTGTRILKCRVSGNVKTWKTRPNDWYVPVKYGMYENAYIGEAGNADDRDYISINGKYSDLEHPDRFFLSAAELEIYLAPKIKGRIGTKKQIKELNGLLS